MEKLFKAIANPTMPKILAIGKNYVKHVKEMGGDKPPTEPVIFTKPFSSINVISKELNRVILPREHEIHHEIELGFMICRTGKNIDPANWQDYIGGYFLALDFTDRDLQGHFKKNGFPWDLAKGQDNFLPVSSLFEYTGDPHNLDLFLKINGKVVQTDNTSSMHYKIPDILAYVSKYMTLNVGDLFLTGTPHGVGPVKQNDYLEGSLKNNEKVLAELNLHIQ